MNLEWLENNARRVSLHFPRRLTLLWRLKAARAHRRALCCYCIEGRATLMLAEARARGLLAE